MSGISGISRGPDSDEEAFVAAFLQRVAADRAAGRERPFEEYAREFTGHEELLREAWNEISVERTLTADEGVTVSALRNRGETLGPYRLDSLLGAGGQGEVWLADDPRLGRRVAIKLLRGRGVTSASLQARFRREAEIASRLDHPGICAIYDSGVEGGTPYIVMRHVEGRTLSRELEPFRAPEPGSGSATVAEVRRGPPPRAEVMRAALLVEKVARAAHAAHEAGVLHRDLKPGNIMIGAGGEPVILDFGLARFVEGDDSLHTLTGELFGTPAYMAPEQLASPPVMADRRIDVYALGVTLFEAVTGRRPFESPTREGLWQQIAREEPPDPRRLNPAVPPDLRAIVLTALEKERDRRYQTAQDLAEDLRRFRGHETIRARPPGPVVRLRRWARRDPMRAAFVALLFLVTAAGGYWLASWPAVREALRSDEDRRRAERIEELVAQGFLDFVVETPGENPRAIFDEARALDPLAAEPLVGRAWCEWREGRKAEARAILDAGPAALRSDPRVALMRTLTDDGAYRELHEALLAGTGEPPQSAFVAYVGALLVGKAGETGSDREKRRALELMRRCIDLAERPRLVYHAQLAHSARCAGDGETAAAAADALLGLWGHTRFTLNVASTALREADPKRALAHAEELVARYPVSGLRIFLAGALMKVGRAQEALEIATAVAGEFPDSKEAQQTAGQALQVLGRGPEARRAFERALEIDPTLVASHHNLGMLLREMDQRELAREHFRECVRLVPGRAEPWQALANSEFDFGDFEASEAAVNKAIELNPRYPHSWNTLGNLRKRRGDLAGTVEAYRESVRLDAGYAVGWTNLGKVLLTLGRTDEAVDALGHIGEPPSDPKVRRNYEQALVDVRRQKKASDDLAAACAGAPWPDDLEEAVLAAFLAETREDWPIAAWAWDSLAARERERGSPHPEFEARVARLALKAARGAGRCAVLERETRLRWLERALSRLEAEVAIVERGIEGESLRVPTARGRLEHLVRDPEVERLHHGDLPAGAPDDLRARNTALWQRYDALLEGL